jgi:hypothetical protein
MVNMYADTYPPGYLCFTCIASEGTAQWGYLEAI